jgi:hypothetical protein
MAATGRSRIAAELKLLVEGHRRNLFDGTQAKRTTEQQAFIADAARQFPAASMLMARTKTQAAALHRSASPAGARTVMAGVAAAAPSPEVVTRVASNAARVNPAAAGVIRQVASASLRPPPVRGGAPQGSANLEHSKRCRSRGASRLVRRRKRTRRQRAPRSPSIPLGILECERKRLAPEHSGSAQRNACRSPLRWGTPCVVRRSRKRRHGNPPIANAVRNVVDVQPIGRGASKLAAAARLSVSGHSRL